MSLCLSVCPFSTKCSRALNLQFSVARESPGAGGVSRESPWAGGVARESPGAVRRYISTLNSDGHTDRQRDRH